MKKKILSLFLASCIVVNISQGTFVHAMMSDRIQQCTQEMSDDINNCIVEEKLDDIEMILEAKAFLSLQDMTNNNDERQISEDELDCQLGSLGVKELTTEEVEKIKDKTSGAQVELMVSVPSSTSYTKWYSYTYDYTYNGEKFTVQNLYAQGLTYGSKLVSKKTGITLYTDKEYLYNTGKSILSYLVNKGVGYLPYSDIIPYEAVFASDGEVQVDTHTMDYTYIETYCFSYVKEYGQSDTWQDLTFVSNKVQITTGHVIQYIKNGYAHTKTYSTNETIRANKFGDNLSAVKRYVNTDNQLYSFVQGLRFKDYYNSKFFDLTFRQYTEPGYITK